MSPTTETDTAHQLEAERREKARIAQAHEDEVWRVLKAVTFEGKKIVKSGRSIIMTFSLATKLEDIEAFLHENGHLLPGTYLQNHYNSRFANKKLIGYKISVWLDAPPHV